MTGGMLLQIVKACLFFFLKSLYNKVLMEKHSLLILRKKPIKFYAFLI